MGAANVLKLLIRKISMEWNAHNSVHFNTKSQKWSANKVVQKWYKFLIDHKEWMKQDLAPIAPKKGLSSTLGNKDST